MPVSASGQPAWCWDADEVLADVDGSTVHIEHLAAFLNCCPEPITFEIHVGDATIFVEEHSQYPCDCECCFNLKVTLQDVPPGPWQLLFRWFDLETDQWTDRILPITVPDVGQALEPSILDQFHEGCLETAGVPPSPPAHLSWGVIKARYH